MRQAGFMVLWRVPGHFNHLHVEAKGQDVARTLGFPQPGLGPAARRRSAGGG
jgi:hypothetical protein